MWALLVRLVCGGNRRPGRRCTVRQHRSRRGCGARTLARASGIVRDSSGPTLVMLAHPRCTCTRASLAELAEIMARATPRGRGRSGVRQGERARGRWRRRTCSSGQREFQEVKIVRDDKGLEAGLFGAETSGQIFLYDRDGQLHVQRRHDRIAGHAGDNAGRASILALLNVTPGPRLRAAGASARQAQGSTNDEEAGGWRALRSLAVPCSAPATVTRATKRPTMTTTTIERRPRRGRGHASCGRFIMADALFHDHQQQIYKRTDRLFAHLMGDSGWQASCSRCGSRRARGTVPTSEIHLHVWAAVFLGGAISASSRAARPYSGPGSRRRATRSRPRRC